MIYRVAGLAFACDAEEPLAVVVSLASVFDTDAAHWITDLIFPRACAGIVGYTFAACAVYAETPEPTILILAADPTDVGTVHHGHATLGRLIHTWNRILWGALGAATIDTFGEPRVLPDSIAFGVAGASVTQPVFIAHRRTRTTI